jgi:hypothetical protein
MQCSSHLVTATRRDIYRSTNAVLSLGCFTEQTDDLQLSQCTLNSRREVSTSQHFCSSQRSVSGGLVSYHVPTLCQSELVTAVLSLKAMSVTWKHIDATASCLLPKGKSVR